VIYCLILTTLEITVVKPPTIKFHKNPFSGSLVVAFGQTDEQKNTTKLMLLSIHKNSFDIESTGARGSQTAWYV
jgi:hypothetical protein